MNLMLVDDEQIVIDSICMMIDFKEYGIEEVYSANGSQDALEIAEQEKIDIMICDIEMPGGSGLELIQQMNLRSPETLSIVLSCHNEFVLAQKAVSLHCFRYVLKPVTRSGLDEILGAAIAELQSRHRDSRLLAIAQGYIKELSGEEELSAVKKVKQYIDIHIGESLSVKELSEMVYLSSNHLTRSFKKEYGMTIIDYITESRLRLAEALLQTSDLTATIIADRVGYFDYSYFSKLFKKHYGGTPTEYRMKKSILPT